LKSQKTPPGRVRATRPLSARERALRAQGDAVVELAPVDAGRVARRAARSPAGPTASYKGAAARWCSQLPRCGLSRGSPDTRWRGNALGSDRSKTWTARGTRRQPPEIGVISRAPGRPYGSQRKTGRPGSVARSTEVDRQGRAHAARREADRNAVGRGADLTSDRSARSGFAAPCRIRRIQRE